MNLLRISGALILFTSVISCSPKVNVHKAVRNAEHQTDLMLKEITNKKATKSMNLVSPRTLENGELKLVPSKDWTSGFFPGELWYLYEMTKNEKWKTEAMTYTAQIEQEKMNSTTHDMGFKVYCSVGNGYRLTKDEHYKNVVIQAAKTLSTRFNPNVGAIRSWDHHEDEWGFPVIIDNMMNLELLFEATKLTGDSTFYQIAVAHANTTMKNHFRADYSTWHVISYNPETGKVEHKNTHQGYSDASAWARGQAWAIYGYTMCYRYTRNDKYLKQAEHVATFIFNNKNMPKDLVPYWDFDAPGIPNEPRDISAAAVIASALFELAGYSANKTDYLAKANRILSSIQNMYSSPKSGNKGFILDHSTGSKPSDSEVDVPLSYADYYYLEALVRKQGK
ncbi:Glucuronyl hydrolase [Arcticibacter svalbardensis MN12-7]|uniref:Glucuronyl hydrolase n=1 Tax=Arcticibacter svalbardensis MN12-7 TaxID=1150600 RepID=R9GPR2_9SPHI|nr:glycoside hydrolase family 88 protein [Arcticibacter svalbardensis]EOR93530.1 Glucuronyl hydrolase [Arcticibacter svalbardensis MN12-7]